jgi:hypothetical protein
MIYLVTAIFKPLYLLKSRLIVDEVEKHPRMLIV